MDFTTGKNSAAAYDSGFWLKKYCFGPKVSAGEKLRGFLGLNTIFKIWLVLSSGSYLYYRGSVLFLGG